MAISKIVFFGQVLIDLTDSTVTPETLPKGVVAYTAVGERIVGTMEITTEDITDFAEAMAEYHMTASATLSTAWSGSGPYTQTVTVAGVRAGDHPHVAPVYSADLATASAQKEAWALVSKAEAGDDTLTFTCFDEAPVTAIPIQVEVNR